SGAAAPEPTTPLPGAPADFSLLAVQVSAIRGLPTPGPLNARVVDGDSLADKVTALAFAEQDPETLESDRRLLVALRLAPEHLDLVALLRELYREQILGIYVAEEKTLYVRGAPQDLSPLGESTAVHEVTHALQDHAFGLVRLQDIEEEKADAALALLALIEGDAVLTERLWSQQHQTAQERAEAQAEVASGSVAALARAPSYIQQALLFPYLEGEAFVRSLHASGGYAAVDAAYARPPATTEQILHPEKYVAGEGSTAVALPDAAGPGWSDGPTYTFGEFDVDGLMAPLGGLAAQEVAAGWAGGGVRSWQRGSDTAVAITLAFDSAHDAAEACAAVPQWYRQVAGAPASAPGSAVRGDRDVMAFHCPGTQVRVGLAPDPQTARRVAGL
ncbi:MAG: hypothetical protein M3N52_08720, partial [Actinomycetota bacterium]|nr:hypothetical protein [Actinomycetota bacterium]